MIIAIAALIMCLNIAQDHDQGYYGVGHDYDQGNELALIKKIVLDCYVRAVLSFLQCFKMIYPNLLGFVKIFWMGCPCCPLFVVLHQEPATMLLCKSAKCIFNPLSLLATSQWRFNFIFFPIFLSYISSTSN